MEFIHNFCGLNLQLFADGGDGGAGAAAGTGVSAGDAGQQDSGVAPAGDAGAAGDAGQQQEDPDKVFEQLIKGQYKDQFGKHVENIFRQRMSGVQRQLQAHEGVKKQFDAAQPIIEILAEKYGLEVTDVEGIAKAAQKDTSFVREEAMALGMDEQELLNLRTIQRQNKSMQRRIDQFESVERSRQMQQEAQAQARRWENEAAELKNVFPGFDLDAELQNEQFKALLKNGIPMRAAYMAFHGEEVVRGAVQYAAQRTEQRVTDSIMAGAGRPTENGAGAQGAVSPKLDPKNLTDDQIKKINEDVRRGKKVIFT